MYYDNEFEFSPETEYENEFDTNATFNNGQQYEEEYEYDMEYGQEYELEEEGDFEAEYDPSFETEGDFEAGADYEDEIRVTDHRTGTTTTARPGYRHAAAPGSYYSRTPAQRIRVVTRPGTNAGNRVVYNRRPLVNPSWLNRPRYPYFHRPHLPWQKRMYWPYNRLPWYRPGYAPGYTSVPFGMNTGVNMPQPFGGQAPMAPQSFQQAPSPQENGPAPDSNGINEQILAAIQNLATQMNSLKQTITEPHPQGPVNEPLQQPANDQAPGKEMNDFEFNSGVYEGEVYDSEASFNEVTEMELASELLSVNTEGELDQFLGKLLQKAVGNFSGFMKTRHGKMLKNLLRNVAKKALPLVGTAAGAYFGGPVGAQAGGNIGKTVSSMFELELEGLSNEDREFEVAKAVVRLAGNAAKQAADNVTGNAEEDTRNALIQAAARFAPGLLVRKGATPPSYNRYDL